MKITYHVLDNNRPATWHLFDDGKKQISNKFKKSLGNNVFSSFEAAEKYAREWCSDYISGVTFTMNTPHDYSGFGDMIEIRVIEE